MNTTTLRELDDKLTEAFWSTWDSMGDRNSYGNLSDLIWELDGEENYDEEGNLLPSEADIEYRVVCPSEGHYFLYTMEFGDRQLKYVVLTFEAFCDKFQLNEDFQTLEEAFDAYLTEEHGCQPWSEEEREHWINQCLKEGFDPEEAARMYDEEWAKIRKAEEEMRE